MHQPDAGHHYVQDRQQHGRGRAGAEEQALQSVDEEEGGACTTGAAAGLANLQGLCIITSTTRKSHLYRH
jgi:hypothetical protein